MHRRLSERSRISSKNNTTQTINWTDKRNPVKMRRVEPDWEWSGKQTSRGNEVKQESGERGLQRTHGNDSRHHWWLPNTWSQRGGLALDYVYITVSWSAHIKVIKGVLVHAQMKAAVHQTDAVVGLSMACPVGCMSVTNLNHPSLPLPMLPLHLSVELLLMYELWFYLSCCCSNMYVLCFACRQG